MNGVAVWYSVGASFAQQSAAPHRGPINAGSSMIGMLEVIERDSTKNLAELSLAEDEVENGSNLSNGSTVWTSVGVSFAHQPAAPEDHWSSGTAGSSIIGLLEEIERDSTKNLAELDFAADEAENRLNVINGSAVWDSVGASLAHQSAAPAAPEDHRSSDAAGSTKMRMLELSESDFNKNLKEPSLEEGRDGERIPEGHTQCDQGLK